MAFVNATPGGTQVNVAPGAPAPKSAPTNPMAGVYGNVPNPGNPAQQEINNPIPKQPAATTTAAPPATQAPPPQQTANPLDSAYFDQLARLNLSYQNSGAAYRAAQANDLANYNLTSQTLTQALPGQIRTQLNNANSRGILESGIAGQNVGNVQTAYGQRMGAALGKRNAADNAALNRWMAAQGNYDIGKTTALNAAIARTARADLVSGAITPQTTGGGGATVNPNLSLVNSSNPNPTAVVSNTSQPGRHGSVNKALGQARRAAARKGARK